MQDATDRQEHAIEGTRPKYEAPALRIMDEAEVLKTFQITSAGVSWWVS